MAALTASPLRRSPHAVSFDARTPSGDFDITFSVEGAEFTGDASFLVPTLLMAAMRSETSLVLQEPVSPTMLEGSRHIAQILALWERDFRPVEIEAPPRSQHPPEPTHGTAAFFSGGVDGFHTVLRHRDELTHLIFIEGVFDRGVEDAQDLEVARSAARELGLPLIEVTTNMREFTDAMGVPFVYAFGHTLAAVALLFESTFATMLIASSFSYDHLPGNGSHPLTDPLWSTEALRVVHVAAEVIRPMKVLEIADSDIAMRHLRVCRGRKPGKEAPATDRPLNCGRCEKCLRTMINLRAVGALDRCKTFPRELDLERVREIRIRSDEDLAYVAANLRAVEERQSDEELVAALRDCFARNNIDPDEPLDARALNLRLNDAQSRLADAEARAAKAERRAASLAGRAAAMTRSLSWRVTAPLRARPRRRR